MAYADRWLVQAVRAPIPCAMTDFFPMPRCHVEQIMPASPDFLHIAARGIRPGSRRPQCGRASRAVHSRYRRKAADLPSLGREVCIG